MNIKTVCLLLTMARFSVAVPRKTDATLQKPPASVLTQPRSRGEASARVQPAVYASAAWGSEVAQRRTEKLIDNDNRSKANCEKRVAPCGLHH
jgi:hypothetical protein